MFKLAALASLVALLPSVLAQQSEWGQCGGIGWSGATTCKSGDTCVHYNDYYYQCVPNSIANTSTTSTSTSTTSSHSTTTTSSTKTSTTSTTSTTKTTSSTSTSTTSTTKTSSTTSTSTSSTTTSSPTGNPFAGCNYYISPYYASEVSAAAAQITDSALKTKAQSVANIPTFVWLDSVSKIPDLDTYMADAAKKSGCTIVPIVVYDLPNRDCHAKASNGEFHIADNGVANYENYIDQIVAIVKKYPTVKVVAVIEPDSLANLVTNLSDQNCANAHDAYLTCVNYAITKLAAVGVIQYIDAGHAGWLGWTSNLQPAAQLFAQVYQAAGKPPQLRGLATNVANYNALSAASPDPITQGDPNYDELHYINSLSPYLVSAGWDARFIVDQGRSGVQNIRQQWGDWCNIKGAGFGTRPTTNTGSSLIDAIVWVKPGGESDGTSNSSSPRYDSTCSLSDADQPAPEAGTWFQEYFQTLVQKANPAL